MDRIKSAFFWQTQAQNKKMRQKVKKKMKKEEEKKIEVRNRDMNKIHIK